MAEVTLNIHGRNYGISCDDGQERRVAELGRYIDDRMKEIGRAGAAGNESHLLVLTAMMLADEVYDLRDELAGMSDLIRQTKSDRQDDTVIVQAIDQLAERIDSIAGRIQRA